MGWLFDAAGSAFRDAIVPARARDDLLKCLSPAIDHACALQDLNAEAIRAMIIDDATEAQNAALLSTDFAHASMPAAWQSAMREALTLSSTIDVDDADVDDFCRTSFHRYIELLLLDASRPDSRLASPVMLSALRRLLSEMPADDPPAPLGAVSNLPLIPAPARLFNRTAVADTEKLLQLNRIVHLCGGPGTGKSSVARLVAERARADDEDLSVWWVDASTRESLEASCAQLCAELSADSGVDELAQARALFAGDRTWLIVVDNLTADLHLDEFVPSRSPSIRVVVTARSTVGAPPDSTVPFGEADPQLMTGIAQSMLAGSIISSHSREVIEACEGNPLVLATVCQYLVATGATDQDVLDLLDARPDVVLDEILGSYYPNSYVTVVSEALDRLRGTTGSTLLIALSVTGGNLRRIDLEKIIGTTDRTELFEAFRAVRTLGLVDISREAISCHALLASLITVEVDERQLQQLVERVYSFLEAEAPRGDGLDIREYVRIGDAVSANGTSATDSEFRARLALAQHLCLYGLGRTADHQLARAESAMPEPQTPQHRAQLTITRAQVSFHRGLVVEAEALAREALELNLDRARDSSAEATAHLVTSAALCIAQCSAYFENWDRATDFAQYAVEASGGAPEVKAAQLNLLIASTDARERLSASRQIANAEELSRTTRAEAYALASGAALDLEKSTQAIEFARRALELDVAETGEDSQFAARDLNDLGNALIAAGELDEAERCLRDSIAIYEGELTKHGFAVLPRMHLARVLTERTRQLASSPWTEQCDAALAVLEPALNVQGDLAPSTIEMSSLLVAQANATANDARATDLLQTAIEIDRELYGDGHPEVVIDVLQRASRLLMTDRTEAALRDLQLVIPHVEQWEIERPTLAVNLLSVHLVALQRRGITAFSTLEIAAVRQHIQRLLPRLSPESDEHLQAMIVLES